MRRAFILPPVLLGLALYACSGASSPPTHTPAPTPPGSSDVPTRALTSTPEPVTSSEAPASPVPTSTVSGHPLPVAVPDLPITSPVRQRAWVQDRIDAVVALYGVSGEGRLWLDGYDLRQMVGQPGWFGSFGSQRWAGVGQAIPHSVLHEVSHSYFGAFPVSGRPDLKWGSDDGSSAIDQYRADLETFMFQPPDHYEPLRERFRNLPNLSRGEYPDLYHAGEADLMYTTGGNLGLIPPILRKYSDRCLEGGRFEGWPAKWESTLARFKSLIIESSRRVCSGVCQETLLGLSSINASKRALRSRGSGMGHQIQLFLRSSLNRK